MATTTLPAQKIGASPFKTVLWISLGLTTLFVFITSEVMLYTDYPMYHAYRLQVIADRHLLIPHALAGTLALLIGPVNFSSRIRQRYLKLHRTLGLTYVVSVFVGSFTGIALAYGRPGLPGTSMQATAWMVCTTAAFIAARNHQITAHRQWMARSYAVTFTFVSSRVLNLWPRYWAHLGDVLSAVGVIAFTLASLLIVDIGLNWHELTTRRKASSAAARSSLPTTT
ncbi:MAG: DUF2306 domain-containing protein [Acidobacteriaceae bacterium]